MSIYTFMLYLWLIVLQICVVQQREQLIDLQTDNATHGQTIRASSNFENMNRLIALEKNLKLLLGRDYKEYQLSTRQVAALKQRDKDLHPNGNNLPY